MLKGRCHTALDRNDQLSSPGKCTGELGDYVRKHSVLEFYTEATGCGVKQVHWEFNGYVGV